MKITKRQLQQIIKEEKAKLQERAPQVSAARQAEAVEQIEKILNDLYDDGADNATLITLLKQIIIDIGRGYVGQPS